jgi:hypothetical protein
VNFAFLMGEDVRSALLGVEGVRQMTVRLGEHCAPAEIEATSKGSRFLRTAASPLRGRPHGARGTGGQWFILPCVVERAAARCRWIIGASKHRT